MKIFWRQLISKQNVHMYFTINLPAYFNESSWRGLSFRLLHDDRLSASAAAGEKRDICNYTFQITLQ